MNPWNNVRIIEHIPKSMKMIPIMREDPDKLPMVLIVLRETQTEISNPIDTFVRVIIEKARIMNDRFSNLFQTSQAVIITTFSTNILRAHERFKMISTAVKSGYDQVSAG